MNTTLISIRCLAVATVITLASPVVKAQTFTGQAALTNTPSALRVLIHPANEEKVRVCYEHKTGGAIRVQLFQQDKMLYNDYALYKPAGIVKMDLSALPAGEYTIAVQTWDAHFAQAIQIGSSTGRLIRTVDPKPIPAIDTGNILVKQ